MNKKAIIAMLVAIVTIMAVGYALLGQNLTINGTANISSNFQIEITNIMEKEKSIGTTTNSTSKSGTTASFNVGFTSPGDYAIYEVTVTNKGSIDAVLSNMNITTDNNEAIIYETSGITTGTKITKNNGTNKLEVRVEYNSAITSQPENISSDIELILGYEQDVGQQVVPQTYQAYSVGQQVQFKNANWRVLTASDESTDYVTLIKEDNLTSAELGNYAIKYNGNTRDEMVFYWSSTCHLNSSWTYDRTTYNSMDTSGCDNHNDYAGSKINEFLSGTYLNTLGANKLKEVDGYKIRLVKVDELVNNGWFNSQNYYAADMPSWLFPDDIADYVTMTQYTGNGITSRVYYYKTDPEWLEDEEVYEPGMINPVINLLKSAIE